jgi:hypothetical protein
VRETITQARDRLAAFRSTQDHSVIAGLDLCIDMGADGLRLRSMRDLWRDLGLQKVDNIVEVSENPRECALYVRVIPKLAESAPWTFADLVKA